MAQTYNGTKFSGLCPGTFVGFCGAPLVGVFLMQRDNKVVKNHTKK